MNGWRRWLVMACLCLSGGIIFMLPFLSEVYYIPLQNALALTNRQLGLLMSIFGTVSLLAYFPGGWLADRFSSRKLIAFSMLASGLAGLYLATFPPFPLALAVYGFWGLTCSLTFWGALIKATRNWAPGPSQGKAFGLLESGRGIAEVLSSTALLALFAALGGGKAGLASVILLFSAGDILLAVLAWFTLAADPEDRKEVLAKRSYGGLGQMLQVLRMPIVWLMAIVILAAYSAYWGSFYFTPYATDVLLMSVVFGGMIGVGKMWLKPVSALGAGFLADKVGVARILSWSFAILTLSFGLFALIPGHPQLVVILIVNTAVAALAIFALRGIYFALLEEGGVPLAITGTVAGLMSALGFTPDIFMPLLGGMLLDRFPSGLGYRYLFAFNAGLCVIGLLSCLVIQKKYGRRR